MQYGRGVGIMPTPPNFKLDSQPNFAMSRSKLSESRTPQLAHWTMQDLATMYPASVDQSPTTRGPLPFITPRLDPEVWLTKAFKQVEKMLNGEISLEYFVSLVERSSGMERWSLWMEISGRMQISQSFSRQEEQMVPGEFPGSGSTARRSGNYFDLAIEHEKKVARSIMRKSLLCHIETQTEDEDFDEPFLGDPNLKTIMVSKKSPRRGSCARCPNYARAWSQGLEPASEHTTDEHQKVDPSVSPVHHTSYDADFETRHRRRESIC